LFDHNLYCQPVSAYTYASAVVPDINARSIDVFYASIYPHKKSGVAGRGEA
jgi:hypothetical protein